MLIKSICSFVASILQKEKKNFTSSLIFLGNAKAGCIPILRHLSNKHFLQENFVF